MHSLRNETKFNSSETDLLYLDVNIHRIVTLPILFVSSFFRLRSRFRTRALFYVPNCQVDALSRAVQSLPPRSVPYLRLLPAAANFGHYKPMKKCFEIYPMKYTITSPSPIINTHCTGSIFRVLIALIGRARCHFRSADQSW